MSKMQTLNQKLRGQGGFVVTGELLLITVILIIGLIVGLVNVRDAANAELSDVAEAFGALDQSYSINGIENSQQTAGIAFSGWSDSSDTNAGDDRQWDFTQAANDINGAGGEAADPAPGDAIAVGVLSGLQP